MNIPDDVEMVVGLGIDKDDKLVVASYLELEDLEAFLEDCLDIVRERQLKESFTLQ
jgi:hypothetical protein